MAKEIRIRRLSFHAGQSVNSPPLDLEPGTVTVLVGPNGSGKSLALREIESWCLASDAPRRVIASIDMVFPTDYESALDLLRVFEARPPEGTRLGVDELFLQQHVFRPNEIRQNRLTLGSLRDSVCEQRLSAMRAWLATFYVVRLAGRTRFALTDPQVVGDLIE